MRAALAAHAGPSLDVPPLSPSEAAAAAAMSFGQFVDVHYRRWRKSQLVAGTIAESTETTSRVHCDAFARWDADAAQRPEAWPRERPWVGMPLEFVSSGWLERFALAKAKGDKAWKLATLQSCATSISTALNHAAKLGAIRAAPPWPNLRDLLRGSTPDSDDEDGDVRTLSDDELGRVFAAVPAAVTAAASEGAIRCRVPKQLAGLCRDLIDEAQLAIALGANCGLRPADLMRLELERHVRLARTPPEVSIRANKTGKRHRLPLAAPTVDRLRRFAAGRGQLPGVTCYVFRRLTNPHARFPMSSLPYRRSVQILRRALAIAGLDPDEFPKPWHCLRKTCTTRFNAHGFAIGVGPIGKLLTHGKDSDVASQHYDNPFPQMVRAVETISWPAEFEL